MHKLLWWSVTLIMSIMFGIGTMTPLLQLLSFLVFFENKLYNQSKWILFLSKMFLPLVLCTLGKKINTGLEQINVDIPIQLMVLLIVCWDIYPHSL